MSNNSPGLQWQCAFCQAVIRNVPAHSLPNCPYCRSVQPGFRAEPADPSRSPAAGAGTQGSDPRSGTAGGVPTLEGSQRSDSTDHQGIKQMKTSGRQQYFQYEQQLAEKQRMIKQQYAEESHRLKTMKEQSKGGKQLGHNEQQVIEQQQNLCQRLLGDLHVLMKQQQELQLKSTLGVESGLQQVSHNQQQTLHQEQQQQLTHVQQHKRKQQLQVQHGSQQQSHDQHQLTDECEQTVKEQMRAWKMTSQEQDTLQQQQRRKQQHRYQQELEQRQRMEQQCKQMAHGDGGIVYCECGTPFRPNARVCANSNCGKPRPRNRPQGPPCVYCGKPLMKEGATRCVSCNGKQPPETFTKPPKGAGTSISPLHGLTHGYGYSNPPQQQPGGMQLHSEMVASPASAFQSPMVFGNNMATIQFHQTTSSVITRQPTVSQTHSGGISASSVSVSSSAQYRQASSSQDSQGSPLTARSGALPGENQAGTGHQPGFPATARPTKDLSTDQQNSTTLPQTPNEKEQESDATANQTNVQMDDKNNSKKSTSGGNGKPADLTTGAGGKSEKDPTADLTSDSQSTPKPGTNKNEVPDPPLDDGESNDEPKGVTNAKKGTQSSGKEGENGANSTNNKNMSYADALGRQQVC